MKPFTIYKIDTSSPLKRTTMTRDAMFFRICENDSSDQTELVDLRELATRIVILQQLYSDRFCKIEWI